MKTETLTCDFCGAVISNGRYTARRRNQEDLKTKHEKTTFSVTVKKFNFSGAEFNPDVCNKCLSELLNEAAELLQNGTEENER